MWLDQPVAAEEQTAAPSQAVVEVVGERRAVVVAELGVVALELGPRWAVPVQREVRAGWVLVVAAVAGPC